MKKLFLITFIFLSFIILISCGSKKKERTSNDIINSSDISLVESVSSEKNDASSTSKNEDESSKENNMHDESNIENSNDIESNITASSNNNGNNEPSTSTSSIKHSITFSYNVYDGSNIKESSNDGKEFGTITQSQTVSDGSTLKLSADLKEGYSFSGWYLNNKRISTSANYDLINVVDDLEIEARLKYQTYDLKLTNENPKAGKVNIDTTGYKDEISYRAKYNDTVTISTDGNIDYLNGFYLDGELLSDELSFDFKMPNKNVEIILVWDIYSITYDLNGGDSNSESNPLSYTPNDDNITLLSPTYTGYNFIGWFDEDDNKVETIDTSIKKNISLKAKWEENENTPYSVQILYFDYDEYEFVLDEENSYTAYGKTNDYTNVEYNDIEGYIKDVSSISQQIIDRFGNTVIQLKYRPVYRNITLLFDDLYAGRVNNKESEYYGKTVSFEIKMSDEYKFLGVYDSLDDDANEIVDDSSLSFDLNIEAENKTYYIKTEKCAYRVNTYQRLLDESGYEITFDANGGSFTGTYYRETITQDSLNLIYEIPTKTDALFRGWYASIYDTYQTSLNQYFTSDKTLYARWLEESDWHYYGIDSENITLGYVNGKYEVCENVYPSNTSYYGGALVFSPLASGKVRMFISGGEYDSLKIYQYKNSNLNEVNYIIDGNYIETSSNLTRGAIYYVIVNGEHGFTYGIDIRGAYPDDYRDFSSNLYDESTNLMQKYGSITVKKDALYNENARAELVATTNIHESRLYGYDLIFLGWYNLDSGRCETYSMEYSSLIYDDLNVEARWKRIECRISNNLNDNSLVTYSIDHVYAPYKIRDLIDVTFYIPNNLDFNEFEYKGELYNSIDDDEIKFRFTLESNVLEIKLNLSYKMYSFNISGDVSNVNLLSTYNSEYEYNSLITISVNNESGHTLKWLNNDSYFTYGDSFEIVVLDNTNLKYELSNVDIDGDFAYFGSYPQSKVADETLLTNLNSKISIPSSYKSKNSTLPSNWHDYGYWSYSADHSGYRTSVYTDVSYNNEKYRAIYIYNYRQDEYIGGTAKATYQSKNSYSLNNIYWFKFEAIKWNILEIDDDGNISLVTSNSIDSTQYCQSNNSSSYSHNGYNAYPTSYEASDIRIWLNNNFYNLAFDMDEKNLLNLNFVTGVDDEYSTNSTEDYVYILSRAEVDSYNMDVENDGTDYALAQGFNNDNKASWTRTPYSNTMMYKTLGSMPRAYYTYVGVRPVINVTI